jgi:hypothetical protein
MENFVTLDKVPTLVHDLLVSETWRHKVLPLIREDIVKKSGIKAYMCLYHEATVVNLMEVMLYHRTACESSEDALVELIDYCYRRFVQLTNKADFYYKKQQKQPAEDPKAYLNTNSLQELEKNELDIEFSCSMICFSLIRFISDHMSDLAVPIVHQMMENNDIPCVLVPMLEIKPWIRKNSKGETERYEDQKWSVVKGEDANKIPKIEA